MEKYHGWIAWAAIAHASLTFLQIRLPLPSHWDELAHFLPAIKGILLTIMPMLLFAAGIGIIKQWEGGRPLFALWAAIAGVGALIGLQYDPIFSTLDLAILGGSVALLYWRPRRRQR